jgi:uncharacterized membrane protein YkvI
VALIQAKWTPIKALRVLFIPAGVILSTMFGGGYGSGRETATFVSTYGPWGGVLATVIMAVVFGLILAVCLELARVFQVFEYASFSRVFLGKAAVVYEVVLEGSDHCHYDCRNECP